MEKHETMWRICAEIAPLIVAEDERYIQETDTLSQELARAAGLPEREPSRHPVWNLDGVSWHDADPPRRGHKHWAQTVGQLALFEETWRCPCGAIARDGHWMMLDKPRVSGVPVIPASLPRLARPLFVFPIVAVILSLLLGFGISFVVPPDLSFLLSMVLGLGLGVGSVLLARSREGRR